MPDELKKIAEELKGQVESQAKEIQETVGKVVKSHEELDGTVKQIHEQLGKLGKAQAESVDNFKARVEQVEKLETALQDLVEKFTKLPDFQRSEPAKSIGQIAAANEEVSKYQNGNLVLAKNNVSPFIRKDLVGDVGASGGDTVVPFHRPEIITEPDTPLTIRDLLVVLTIATNAVEWAKENVFTNAAAPQAGEGAPLPESNITFTKESTPVQTIGHWIAISRQLLADNTAIGSFADRRMVYGLKLAEEIQLLTGDGLGNNLDGLIPNATAYNVGLDAVGDTKLDNMRKAILQVNLSGYPADAVVMNPTDFADFQLTKTSEGAYIYANPVEGGALRVWGKRVVESLNMTSGDYLVGSFTQAATLWDRQDVTLRVAEQHASFAIEGLVAMILEERLALTVERPLGLVTGTLHETTV